LEARSFFPSDLTVFSAGYDVSVLPISGFGSDRSGDGGIAYAILCDAGREPAPPSLNSSSTQASAYTPCYQAANDLGGFCPTLLR